MSAAPLTSDQIGSVMQAVAEYLRVLRSADGGRHYPPTDADVTHSALLFRLLTGKSALPIPPPRTFSYPNYTLGEGEPYEAMGIHDVEWDGEPRVCVDQCTDWERVAPDRLRHVPTGDVYRITGGTTLQKEAKP